MMTPANTRVMWLLNHSTARKFELHMLKEIGFREIFLPKICPSDPLFRSTSIDYSEDANLTIPAEDLAILNGANWYENPSLEAWEIANKHFDIIFFILHSPEMFFAMKQNFQGALLWRVYGLGANNLINYSMILQETLQSSGKNFVEALSRRFWFAQAYEHLHQLEGEHIARRHVYLPLGLFDYSIQDHWEGNDRRILFVCPDIGFTEYYHQIYKNFIRDFKGLPYAIGGGQPIALSDPNVLGFIPREVYDENMRQMRVMFYHSREKNHIHYHPFEAVRLGMPLVFMAGGLLDRLGGSKLPGRCKTIAEARRKVERILNNDRKLIESIRGEQGCILEAMKPQNCVDEWRLGFQRILQDLEHARKSSVKLKPKPKRIAVIIPVAYGGGSLRGTKLLLQAIAEGSKQAGESIELVVGCLEEAYESTEFEDLEIPIAVRPYQWRILKPHEVNDALVYASFEPFVNNVECYQVPDDGMKQFLDCDLWIIISDRLEHKLLPIRPYVLMVYDYIQRHEPLLTKVQNEQILAAAHGARRVLVTTKFTQSQAINFAGLLQRKVELVPMLVPSFTPAIQPLSASQSENQMDEIVDCAPIVDPIIDSIVIPDYFIWTTNRAVHKNHLNAFKALKIYYEELDGRLLCQVTGVDTKKLLDSKVGHLSSLIPLWENTAILRKNVTFLGELADSNFQQTLAQSSFLWHPARIDNGTFSVIEAAQLGVPSLSSDYPPMREIDDRFGLNLTWMDPHDPRSMAKQLKFMESNGDVVRSKLPTVDSFKKYSVNQMASQYWEVIRQCL
jgi:glycosyltransferase involved in cell wall biosynthesis